MAEYIWPPDIIPSSQTWGIEDSAGAFRSPLSGTVRTVSRAGSRLRCKITVPPIKGTERLRLIAFLNNLRGISNTAWVPDYSIDPQGNLSVDELLTNNGFSNGTTGWSASNSVLTVADSVMRITAAAAGASVQVYRNTVTGLTQYAPYILRTSILDGAQSSGLTIGPYLFATFASTNYSTSRGLVSTSQVVAGTAVDVAALISATTGFTAGAYFSCNWTSLSRCALVDNGPNALLQSDVFGTTWALSGFDSVSTNSNVAPDGTTTGDAVNEDGAASTHLISQTVTVASTALDYAFSVCVKIGNRSWCALEITEATGSTSLNQYFNASTGAIGTNGTTGANWSNRRTFSTDLGGGWFRFTIVGRKTNAATSLVCKVYAATADGTANYTGGSFSALALWRATLAQSSVPTRGAQTTTTATTGTAQTGSGIYLKGLPASTAGVRKAGDPVQIGSQINFLTSDLDSDAAGLGYMQCGLPWRVSPSDNDPVIFNTPMAKMRLASEINWDTGPGLFSPFELEFVEDVS